MKTGINNLKARKIKLLLLDVDGVLTDGGLIFSDKGIESKTFNVRDGHGIVMLLNAGIPTIFITGRKSKAVLYRAKDLSVKEVYQNTFDKVKVLKKILSRYGLKPENVAYMGDDVTDIPILKSVGLSATVSDGVAEVKKFVNFISTKKGGRGAVRELAEFILKSKKLWDNIVSNVIKKYV
ncbi:MAG TPA: HAD-IIIA family hydrolase [bacterium]